MDLHVCRIARLKDAYIYTIYFDRTYLLLIRQIFGDRKDSSRNSGSRLVLFEADALIRHHIDALLPVVELDLDAWAVDLHDIAHVRAAVFELYFDKLDDLGLKPEALCEVLPGGGVARAGIWCWSLSDIEVPVTPFFLD